MFKNVNPLIHIDMRIKYTKVIAFFVVFINIIAVYYSVRFIGAFRGEQNITNDPSNLKPSNIKSPNKHISKLVTVIIREFEASENDVTLTVQSVLKVLPSIQIYVLFDEVPYPPLNIMLNNVSLTNIKLVNLSPSLRVSFSEHSPVLEIKTKYVLFIPDAIRISSRQSLQYMLNAIMKYEKTILVSPVAKSKMLDCLRVNVNTREWTLKYGLIKGTSCDAVNGKHVTLLETSQLKMISNAFILPFPHSLYLQTAALNNKVMILKPGLFREGRPILKSHHTRWKQRQINQDRLKQFYKKFKIKQVFRESGITEWYGCNRDIPRCFPPVLDSMPSYLYEERWTPPCCLANLRKTAKHVFNALEESGIRYWLEAGSLLGAMRSGDILPWDHDVDIGFIKDDIDRCIWLKKTQDKSTIDTNGFLWEKATEGNFYRVYYSKSNRIYVNLFPFYSKNGTISKDSWFTSHKRMEFPDNFLHPMSSIEFIGLNVPSPNNIRDFLELKFGKGSIENPEYPDPDKLKFP